jgi:hypothetical protein
MNLGNVVEYAHDALDDVVNIGEVASMVSMVEHVDGFASENASSEVEQCHVGTSPRSIHREEA